HGDVLMWLMKTLLTSGCTNQRGAGQCLAQYTQHELDLVAAQLNNRPRKTLKFKTPKEIIERGVALTD
ncbi:hypothetical protein N6O60_18475, partial [Escherichia coli]|nr:hypothetical protein [Escherichia coli]